MCQYISFVASTEGALEIYAAPGLNSHGAARAGWGIKDGAECEWTGEGPESLAVRFEDKALRDTVRAMILEKYATRKELIHSITEMREADGTRYWYKEGKLHRAGDKPAIEYADGSRAWYKDGLRHRDGDLPAVEWASGDREWYKEGKLNRAGDKPAIECADGYRFWYKDGKLHRDGDKPAVKYPNGTREWYKDGVKYTPKSK
jgi:hypothetical protein